MRELMKKGPKHILMEYQKNIFRDYLHVAHGIICEPLGVVEWQVWTNDCQLIYVPKVLQNKENNEQ